VLSMQDCTLLCDYVYLDTEERRRFAQVGHEYLIEQLQNTGSYAVPASSNGTTNTKVQLNFNHPTKEIIWGIRGGNYTSGQSFLAYSNTDDWSSALDNAALNIATGMFKFVLSTGTSGAPSLSGFTNVTAGGAFLTNPANNTHVINIDISGNIATNNYLYMAQNVFYSGKYNLGDKIDFLAITTNSAGTGLSNINVLANTMSIRDISIPISSWTDNRTANNLNTFNSIANITFQDIIVYEWHNFGVLLDGTGNPVLNGLLQLNGHDRFQTREGSYFNYVQPLQHHTRTPADGINVYSFALHPEQHQPSGSCNLSRIDNTQLNLNLQDPTMTSAPQYAPSLNFFTSDTNLYVYAINYNVLRIMSGMGGLAYSN
jgi:hypothetical protein